MYCRTVCSCQRLPVDIAGDNLYHRGDYPGVLCIAELYEAVYAYQSDVAGDLTFTIGEIIQVSKMEGDWWTGSIGDKTGIFPANYVKKSETQASRKYLDFAELLY